VTDAATRWTKQQSAVLEALQAYEGFVSAQDIHAQLRSAGATVGLATVYRALQRIVDEGRADAVRSEAGEVGYRACSRGHHHHLMCRHCGRAVELEGPQIERWARQVARTHGFTDVEHTVELFGTCDDCATR
jgi:Fur family ferric uptake transcriptional regulator